MNTAAGRFQRLMLALPRFATERIQSLSGLAASLEVPPEVLINDLRTLAERYDLPGGADEAVTVVIEGDTVTVEANHFLRPMRLSQSELAALELGLRLLGRDASDEQTVMLDNLRARLAQCIASLPRDEAHAGLRDGALSPEGDTRIRTAIRRALRQSRVLRIHYLKSGDSQGTSRDIRPFRLCWSNGAWYLVAWCELGNGLRNFRVDRVTTAELTDRSHGGPEGLDEPALMSDGVPFLGAGSAPTMVLRYSASIARWIAERDGLPLEADGSAVRTMPLADRAWAIRHVLQYGSDCSILEPADLRRELVETLEGMAGSLS